jgi:hypothetical protein
LLPVQGSETNWYKNVLKDPTIKISINGMQITKNGKPITDSNKVKDIVDKFKSKYGSSEVKKYYTKFDVGGVRSAARIIFHQKSLSTGRRFPELDHG